MSGTQGWDHCRSAAPSRTGPCSTSSTGGDAGSLSPQPRHPCHRNDTPFGKRTRATRYQRAYNRGDPQSDGTVRCATCEDPQSTTGQRRRDILSLDPPRAAPTGSAQRSRADRGQQNLASPRRHNLKGASAARHAFGYATRRHCHETEFGRATWWGRLPAAQKRAGAVFPIRPEVRRKQRAPCHRHSRSQTCVNCANVAISHLLSVTAK